jgi:predicted enzyme related to lactoylglutathione lyase
MAMKGAKKASAKKAPKAKKTKAPKAKAKAPRKAPARKAAPKKKTKKASVPSVVHWEVQAKNPAKQQQFFAELFGWEVDANNPMSYGMVAAGGKDGIGGGIGATEDSARVTFYVQVSDINDLLVQAESLGAKTVMPRTDIGMVVMAQFRDLEGNVIGLIEA